MNISILHTKIVLKYVLMMAPLAITLIEIMNMFKIANGYLYATNNYYNINIVICILISIIVALVCPTCDILGLVLT